MKIITILILLFIINTSRAQQICKTETEIPSSTPDTRFVDNHDGTILDSLTGLMWQKCQVGFSGLLCDIGSHETFNWQEALLEAESNEVAGYTDWNLPNIRELESIVELRCHNPRININIFPNTSTTNLDFFWTSSPYVAADTASWVVSFDFGNTGANFRGNSGSIRLVRSTL